MPIGIIRAIDAKDIKLLLHAHWHCYIAKNAHEIAESFNVTKSAQLTTI